MMARRIAGAVIVLLVCGMVQAERGFVVCVGVEANALAGDVTGARATARSLGEKFAAGGYATVVVLTDDAKHFASRATLGNIRNQVEWASQLAGGDDRVVFTFSGAALTLDGSPAFAPAHADEDNALPVGWVLNTLARSKAKRKVIVVDVSAGETAASKYLAGRESTRVETILAKGAADVPADLLKMPDGVKPIKDGHARVRFIMHRNLIVVVSGTTYENWRYNNRTFTLSFPFSNDSHVIMGEVELPADEYEASQVEWRHDTTAGVFKGGPYKALERRFHLDAGREYVVVQVNQQTAGAHGYGDTYFEGERVVRTYSIDGKALEGADIDRDDFGKVPAINANSSLTVANGHRGAGLWKMAKEAYSNTMRDARRLNNRILIARACRDYATMLATAEEADYRNGKRALMLAREALSLAEETDDADQYSYHEALALAYAETGDFDRAATEMAEALRLTADNKPTMVPPHIKTRIEGRLALVRAKKPVRK